MPIRAVLTASQVKVEPGQAVAADLSVRNTGSVVDNFRVELLGDAGLWTAVQPESLALMPGTDGQVRLTFRPPRSPNVRAGQVPFGVKVTSEVNPQDSAVEEGTVEVGAFTALNGELLPQISHGRARGSHELACDNRGNVPLTLGFGATDAEDQLQFEFNPVNVVAEPGTANIVRLRARPRKRFWRGNPKTHRFQTVAQSREAPPVTIEGTYVQEPLLPRWLLPALAALVGLVVALVVLWFLVFNPAIKSAATDAANNALSAAGVQPAPSGGGGGGGGGQSAGGGGPSPSPSAGTSGAPFGPTGGRLAISGTQPGYSVNSPCPPSAGSATPASGSVYVVPQKRAFDLTDLIFQNPGGDSGTLALERWSGNNCTVVLQEGLSNFRDLDFHLVTPITFPTGSQMVLVLDGCDSPVAPTPPTPLCNDGMAYTGNLRVTG